MWSNVDDGRTLNSWPRVAVSSQDKEVPLRLRKAAVYVKAL